MRITNEKRDRNRENKNGDKRKKPQQTKRELANRE